MIGDNMLWVSISTDLQMQVLGHDIYIWNSLCHVNLDFIWN